jgi:glutamine synthetase
VKPKAVLAYCREKGIKAVDIRFPDGLGRWRHFTMPVAGLTESVFETGLGHESCGFQRGTDDHAPWIVTPAPEAKYIDPLQSEPTLVLMASIQEAWTGEEAWFDVRSLAGRTLEAFRGSGIADEVLVATTLPFDLTHPSDHLKAPDGSVTLAPKPHSPFEGGRFDPDASFRSYLMHMAIESGLAIDRHYRGRQSSSEFSLGAKSLVQACDDLLMLESLMETYAQQQGIGIEVSVDLHQKLRTNFGRIASLWPERSGLVRSRGPTQTCSGVNGHRRLLSRNSRSIKARLFSNALGSKSRELRRNRTARQ